MKKIEKIILVVFSMVFIGSSVNAYPILAAEKDEKVPYVAYSIECENDEALIGANLLSSDSYFKDGRLFTVNIYELADGTIIKDTFNVNAVAAYSKNGSDTATRTREISNWGKITITASFTWYTEGLFSYVKCNSMSSSLSPASKLVVKNTWDESYTKDYISIGAAKAQLRYFLYNSAINAQYTSGTFKITCTDSGSISDNA